MCHVHDPTVISQYWGTGQFQFCASTRTYADNYHHVCSHHLKDWRQVRSCKKACHLVSKATEFILVRQKENKAHDMEKSQKLVGERETVWGRERYLAISFKTRLSVKLFVPHRNFLMDSILCPYWPSLPSFKHGSVLHMPRVLICKELKRKASFWG